MVKKGYNSKYNICLVMKGERNLKVCYDKSHDIVSIYFEDDFKSSEKNIENIKEKDLDASNVYNSEKAANLILDTVDIIKGDSVVGFRVFNASKYYDIELLNLADEEILTDNDIEKPLEKVIGVVTKEGIIN